MSGHGYSLVQVVSGFISLMKLGNFLASPLHASCLWNDIFIARYHNNGVQVVHRNRKPHLER